MEQGIPNIVSLVNEILAFVRESGARDGDRGSRKAASSHGDGGRESGS